MGQNLNLAVKKVLSVDAVSGLVASVRRVVSHFHFSNVSAAKLKEKQKQLCLPEHKVIQDVDTRWNSTFDMLERMLEQQVAVAAVLFEGTRAQKELSLEARQISTMGELTVLLGSRKEITKTMSSESSVTISIIAPTLSKLRLFCTQIEGELKFIKDSKQVLLKDIGKRYSGANVPSLIDLAAFLDPGFKALSFLSDQEWEGVHADVVSAIERVITSRDVIGTLLTGSIS